MLPRFLPTPGQAREKFNMDAYANNVVIRGVLSQTQDGQERVISYYNKTLMNKAERNYFVSRRGGYWNIFISTYMEKSLTWTRTTLR
jgi:hypothetical protein